MRVTTQCLLSVVSALNSSAVHFISVLFYSVRNWAIYIDRYFQSLFSRLTARIAGNILIIFKTPNVVLFIGRNHIIWISRLIYATRFVRLTNKIKYDLRLIKREDLRSSWKSNFKRKFILFITNSITVSMSHHWGYTQENGKFFSVDRYFSGVCEN